MFPVNSPLLTLLPALNCKVSVLTCVNVGVILSTGCDVQNLIIKCCER